MLAPILPLLQANQCRLPMPEQNHQVGIFVFSKVYDLSAAHNKVPYFWNDKSIYMEIFAEIHLEVCWPPSRTIMTSEEGHAALFSLWSGTTTPPATPPRQVNVCA
jgi:hypothetical protein